MARNCSHKNSLRNNQKSIALKEWGANVITHHVNLVYISIKFHKDISNGNLVSVLTRIALKTKQNDSKTKEGGVFIYITLYQQYTLL